MNEDKIKVAEQALIAGVSDILANRRDYSTTDVFDSLTAFVDKLDEAKSPLPSMDDLRHAYAHLSGLEMLRAGPYWLRWLAMEGLELEDPTAADGRYSVDEFKEMLLVWAKELEGRTHD